jgi:PAS domain S-box-containing protein
MIFNTIPAMIWYHDTDNRLVKSNKLANDMLGHDDSTKSFHDCEIVLKTMKPQLNIMQTYQSPLGETRWVNIDRYPYQDSQGKLRGAVVFGMDITAYKQAQASLAANEERMYLVVENLPLMLYALDEAGNFLIWNRTCEEVTGYNADEILNNPRALKTLYPELEDRNSVLTRWYHSADEARWETRITCKDGHVKTIAWSSVAKRFPVPGWYSWHIGRDITVHQPANTAVKENENILANMFKELKLGACLTDDRGRFIQMNRAFAEIYGYRQEELLGQPFTTILPAETHGEAVREYYSLLMTHEEPSFMRQRGEVHRSGQRIEVQIMASRVVLEDRRRLMFTVVNKVK